MPFPLLTPRLIIEPLRLSDAEDFVSYRRDPEISRYQSWDENFSYQQAQELIHSQAGVDLPKVGEWLQLAVRDRVNGKLLGDLALHHLDELNGVFEIGFTIAKQHQRQGYAKEAIEALINYLRLKSKSENLSPKQTGATLLQSDCYWLWTSFLITQRVSPNCSSQRWSLSTTLKDKSKL